MIKINQNSVHELIDFFRRPGLAISCLLVNAMARLRASLKALSVSRGKRAFTIFK